MKNPVLFYSLLFTLLIELILITSTYIIAGPERLAVQGIRVFIQLLFVLLILLEDKKGLFILVAYHIIIGLTAFIMKDISNFLILILEIYHILIGLILYFYDYIEDNILKIKK